MRFQRWIFSIVCLLFVMASVRAEEPFIDASSQSRPGSGTARSKRDAIVVGTRVKVTLKPVVAAVSKRTAIDSIRITVELGELCAEPEKDAPLLGYVALNMVLPLYSARNAFFETMSEGKTGWVRQGHAQRISQSASVKRAITTHTGDSVRVGRVADIVAGPSDAAPFIATVREGTMLAVLARQDGWIAVSYRGVQAWIPAAACAKPAEAIRSTEVVRSTEAVRNPERVGRRRVPAVSAPSKVPPPVAATIPRSVDSGPSSAIAALKGTLASGNDTSPPEKIVRKTPHRQGANISWLVFVICLGVAGSTVIMWIAIWIRRKRRARKTARATALRARRKCLVVSKKVKYVQSYMLDMPTTLRHCFEEIGFLVLTAKSMEEARAMSAMAFFEIVLVDWRQCKNGLTTAAQLSTAFDSRKPRNNVIVYNVPNIDRIEENRTDGVHVLGVILTDRDVFSMVTSRILNAKTVHKSQQTTAAVHALDGEIEHTPLSETFQYMELSKKTGCLLVERDGPFGMAYFVKGRIVHASVPDKTGEDAILAILDMKQGKFHFINDKTSDRTTCNFSALAILMEWAYTRDEASRGK